MVGTLSAAAVKVAAALEGLAQREAHTALPGYTHLQQAMPSSVPLWALGFAGEIRDDAQGLTPVLRRIDKQSARFRGRLRHARTADRPARDAARARLRGRARAGHRGAALARQGRSAAAVRDHTAHAGPFGRLAADVLLFATQEFGFLALAEEFTTGSSIMPQKRNPDLFELIRGRAASAQACLSETLGICAKLPSGYQRDLQLLKFPLFRGIDLALATLAILPPGHRGARVSPRGDPAGSCDSCRRRSQPPRGDGGHPVSRGVPPRRSGPRGLESHAASRTLRPRRAAGQSCGAPVRGSE